MARVLVLGAKSDIARALTRRLAAEGFDLYLAARRSDELEADAGDLKVRFGVKADPVEFDMLEQGSHRAMYEGLSEPPHGVVLAASYMGSQKKAEGDFDEAKEIIGSNYTGAVSILNIAAEDLERRGEGFIIGISSAAGERGRQSNYVYGSAKAGLRALLSGLRHRLFRSGVHVMTVVPGFVDTKMTAHLELPGKLTAQPDEVARDIMKALKKKKDVVFTKWIWKYIMFIVRNLPESVFKRTKL